MWLVKTSNVLPSQLAVVWPALWLCNETVKESTWGWFIILQKVTNYSSSSTCTNLQKHVGPIYCLTCYPIVKCSRCSPPLYYPGSVMDRRSPNHTIEPHSISCSREYRQVSPIHSLSQGPARFNHVWFQRCLAFHILFYFQVKRGAVRSHFNTGHYNTILPHWNDRGKT